MPHLAITPDYPANCTAALDRIAFAASRLSLGAITHNGLDHMVISINTEQGGSILIDQPAFVALYTKLKAAMRGDVDADCRDAPPPPNGVHRPAFIIHKSACHPASCDECAAELQGDGYAAADSVHQPSTINHQPFFLVLVGLGQLDSAQQSIATATPIELLHSLVYVGLGLVVMVMAAMALGHWLGMASRRRDLATMEERVSLLHARLLLTPSQRHSDDHEAHGTLPPPRHSTALAPRHRALPLAR